LPGKTGEARRRRRNWRELWEVGFTVNRLAIKPEKGKIWEAIFCCNKTQRGGGGKEKYAS